MCQVDPPATPLEISTMPLEADTPINCDPPTLAEMQAVVRKLKGGKAPGVCGIHEEFLLKLVVRQSNRHYIPSFVLPGIQVSLLSV